jgi:hypothetical protein
MITIINKEISANAQLPIRKMQWFQLLIEIHGFCGFPLVVGFQGRKRELREGIRRGCCGLGLLKAVDAFFDEGMSA